MPSGTLRTRDRPEMLQVQRAPKRVTTQTQTLSAFAAWPAGHPSLLQVSLRTPPGQHRAWGKSCPPASLPSSQTTRMSRGLLTPTVELGPCLASASDREPLEATSVSHDFACNSYPTGIGLRTLPHTCPRAKESPWAVLTHRSSRTPPLSIPRAQAPQPSLPACLLGAGFRICGGHSGESPWRAE